MSAKRPLLALHVLTEDSAASAHDTLVALVKKMLLILDQACRTHLVAFEPQRDRERKAMHGNLWKSKRPLDRPKIILLGRSIAEKLLEQDVPGFVLFHVDGDVPWSRHDESENVAKFSGFVQTYVRQALDHALRLQHKDRGETPTDEVIATQVDAALQRLLRLTPFYSIEAWTYQNTAEARRLCEQSCGRHVDAIKRWEDDPGALDEVYQPKDGQEAICLQDRYNLQLATTGFPAERAFDAGKSFAETVERLLACDDLCSALHQTRQAPPLTPRTAP